VSGAATGCATTGNRTAAQGALIGLLSIGIVPGGTCADFFPKCYARLACEVGPASLPSVAEPAPTAPQKARWGAVRSRCGGDKLRLWRKRQEEADQEEQTQSNLPPRVNGSKEVDPRAKKRRREKQPIHGRGQ